MRTPRKREYAAGRARHTLTVHSTNALADTSFIDSCQEHQAIAVAQRRSHPLRFRQDMTTGGDRT